MFSKNPILIALGEKLVVSRGKANLNLLMDSLWHESAY
jgi:hypothetical protein